MKERYCSQCGAEILPGARYCAGCGRRLGTAQSGTSYRTPWAIPVATLAVAALGAAVGAIFPVRPPSVPGAERQAAIPPGHPPLEIPAEVKRAIAEVRRQADAAPEDLELWTRLAGMQYRAGQFDSVYLEQAEASYRHVLERDPKNLEALRNLGNIAYDRNRHAEAIEFYQRYLAEKPDDLNVQTDMATMYLARGDAEAAIRGYEKVLAAKPDQFQALFNLGIAHSSRGELEQAMAALGKARSAAPDELARRAVDQVMARVRAGSSAPGRGKDGSREGSKRQDPLRAAIESVFRTHPVIAAKLQSIEWTAERKARVVVRDFPMEQMPAEVRQQFTLRLQEKIREAKGAHGEHGPVVVEIVDAGSLAVMETISN